MRSDRFIWFSWKSNSNSVHRRETKPQFVIKSVGGLYLHPVHIGASRHCQSAPPQLSHVITFLLCYNRFCVSANVWTRQSYVVPAKNETNVPTRKRFPCWGQKVFAFSAKSGFNPARVINTARNFAIALLLEKLLTWFC